MRKIYQTVIAFFFLLQAVLSQAAPNSTIYNTFISTTLDKATVKDIFDLIEQKTDFRIGYNIESINTRQYISLKKGNQSVYTLLKQVITDNNAVISQVDDRNVLIRIIRPEPADKSRKTSDITVKGKVTSTEGIALPGVNIQAKGSTQAIVTDAYGQYSIRVPAHTVLLYSYVGYISQEIQVAEDTSAMDIVLKVAVKGLNEVVVVGYGAQQRNEVIGAVSSAPVGDIRSRNYNNTTEILQGTVPGVTVTNNGGDPTSSPSINIRGIGSINSESPLLVVDGVVYAGGFNTINPNDIASVSVLKDAAAAIYGARASGGVILVTTKKGAAGNNKVSLNYQAGMQKVAKKLKALNAAEFADVENQVRKQGGLSPDPAFDPSIFPDARTTKTIWMDEIFQTGHVQNVDASMSGGTNKSTFFLSGGYRRNDGILLNTHSDKLTSRINSSHRIGNAVTFGENLSFSLTNGQSASTSDAYTGSILTAIFYPPNATIYKQDGSGQFGGVPAQYPGSYGDVINPVAYLKRLDVNAPQTNLLLNPYLEYTIVKGLTFRSNWSYTRIQSNMKRFNTKILEPGKIFDYNELIQSSTTFTSLLNEQTLQYEHTFAGKHHVNILAGHTYESWKNETFGLTANGFDNEDPNYRYLDNSTSAIAVGKFNGSGYQNNLESYLARVNYSYEGKYLLNAIVRRDGTSKLTSANRWEWYPSVAAGWLLNKEGFLAGSHVINTLKLRASWGEIGNLGVLGNYAFSTPLSKTQALLGQTATINAGFAETQLSNPNLKWEISEQKNIGADFGLLGNRLYGSLDVFSKNNRRMLLTQTLPGIAGTPGGTIVNAGNMENRGVELSLTYSKQTGDLRYSLTANGAHLHNELKSLYQGNSFYQTGPAVRSLPLPNIAMVGAPFNAFYGYKMEGLFESDAAAAAYVNKSGQRLEPNAKGGDIRFADLNGDGVLNSSDEQVLGSSFPAWTYSLNMNFSYKNFDLDIFFQGSAGNKIFNAVKYTGLNASFPGYNLLADVKNAWTPQNIHTDVPRLSYTDANNNFGRISNFYMEDGSYLRMKNVTLGYTFPEQLLKKLRPRIYITAENLFTITKYSGMDPEVGLNNSGMDLGLYPVSRVFLVGINVNL